MKKFLAFLLIAIIACKTVKEMEDEELIKGVIDKIIKSLDKAILDPILQTLKTLGEKAAEKVCCTLVPDVCSLCGLIVKAI